MRSWRSGTAKQYATYTRIWQQFLGGREGASAAPNVEQLLIFLTALYKTGISHSTINTARSAVSATSIDKSGGTPLGQHPLVTRFMRGVFNDRPHIRQHTRTWDVQQVLDYMSANDISSSNMLQLSRRTSMLLALLSGKRGQSIHSIKIQDIHISANILTIAITEMVKQTRPGVHDSPICIPAYPRDQNICAIFTLREYLNRTKEIRGDAMQLFISTTKPHKAISRSTISRWLKDLMLQAGIPPEYQARSTRGAATSASTAPLQTILSAAGWTKESTFRRHYQLPVHTQAEFATGLLEARSRK
jgi:integrase